MPQNKVKYKDYADYLKSDKWKQVKQDYYKNEQISTCLRCSTDLKQKGVKSHHHHFNYPSDWNDDTWENLIIVCEECHNELHRQIDANDGCMPSIRSLMLEFSQYRFGQGSIFRENCIAQAFSKKVNFWLDKDGDMGGLIIDGQKITCPSLALAVRKTIIEDSWREI